jgi:exodeoxyribonuclease-5
MAWSPQQSTALDAVAKWLKNPHGKQIFRLFGFAGSGKTTLARHLSQGIEGRVLFAAFTGKAALVLKSKGCYGASTIHSLIYKPVEDELTGITEFVLNHESDAAGAALIVIDEVSMVGEDLARDLLSFGAKILVLGDPAQLPPVKGEGFFINAEPDVMLTEVHRQAAENPIIRLSIDVREGRGLVPGTYGDSRVVRRAEIDRDELQAEVLCADQVLCGLNRTRQAFNLRARQIKGLAGAIAPWHPTAGDRLVCLRNDKTKGLLNGGLWEATSVAVAGKKFNIRVKSLDMPQQEHVDTEVLDAFFLGTEGELDWKVKRHSDQFTYGQVLTCHKAQGSSWPGVLVFDESSVFREDAAKWTYTAITRAAERATIVI